MTSTAGQALTVGAISDTHGLLRPEAMEALADVDHILHAGDVGDAGILDELRTIAPVTAIRGNVDVSGPCAALPATLTVELGGCRIYMVHSVYDLFLDPQEEGIAMVVSGHSHRAGVERRNGVVYLNPGSAGPRRFDLPVTVAKVKLAKGEVHPRIVTLKC